MDNYDYAAGITFVSHGGSWIPWTVRFRSALPPFRSYTIGFMPGRDVRFSIEEIRYNTHFADFLRSRVEEDLDEIAVDVAGMRSAVEWFHQKIEEEEEQQQRPVVVGAVDLQTFWYLQDVLPNVVLIKRESGYRDLTLAAVVDRHRRIRSWVEEDEPEQQQQQQQEEVEVPDRDNWEPEGSSS